jgi:carboxyl-terminal processing protease
MPDIFVPHDTTYYTPYYTNVLNNGIVYDFSFAFVDKHRAKLSTYDTWEKLVEYLVKKTTYFSEFIGYAEQKGVSRNSQEIAKSKALLANLLQAYIARNLLGDEAFYPILNLQDNTVKKAIEMVGKPIQ